MARKVGDPVTDKDALIMIEYLDFVTTCWLAVEFNKTKPNKAIKNVCKKIRARAETLEIRALCEKVHAEPYPVGWLARQERNIIFRDKKG